MAAVTARPTSPQINSAVRLMVSGSSPVVVTGPSSRPQITSRQAADRQQPRHDQPW
jgi:hypothetical protein